MLVLSQLTQTLNTNINKFLGEMKHIALLHITIVCVCECVCIPLNVCVRVNVCV